MLFYFFLPNNSNNSATAPTRHQCQPSNRTNPATVPTRQQCQPGGSSKCQPGNSANPATATTLQKDPPGNSDNPATAQQKPGSSGKHQPGNSDNPGNGGDCCLCPKPGFTVFWFYSLLFRWLLALCRKHTNFYGVDFEPFRHFWLVLQLSSVEAEDL